MASMAVSSAVHAQVQTDSSFVEGLPQYLERRISADEVNATLRIASAESESLRGLVSRSRRWAPGDTLRVCFFGGSRSLRSKIAKTASAWVSQEPPLQLDFGDINNPRLCGTGLSHIRVGYDFKGYWSLVGKDSLVYASQLEQSMNFSGFNINPPGEDEFRRVVLHEFGHALGFQHEHQNPLSSCAAEFNWPYIYSYLKGPPNFWDDQTINHNLRQLPYYTSDINTGFDKESIMLYTFPTSFYTNGDRASCYSPGNYDLSSKDLATLKSAYTRQPQDLEQIAAYSLTLDDRVQALLNDRVAFLKLDSSEAVLAASFSQIRSSTPTFSSGISELLVMQPMSEDLIEKANIDGAATLPS